MQTGLPFPDISPEIVSFTLLGMTFALRWYAMAYIVGLLIGWRLAVAALRRGHLWAAGKSPMAPQQAEDLLTWIVIGVIAGGRLGYVLFYKPMHFLANPQEIPAVWQGGMSFHGGFVGVVLAVWIWSRRKGVALPAIADMIALTATPAILLVRIANFINAELWGRPTTLPWGVIFPGEAAQDCGSLLPTLCARHPSQLYEALAEGLILGGLIMLAGLPARGAQAVLAAVGHLLHRLRADPLPARIRAPARCAVRVARQSSGAGVSPWRLGPDHGPDPDACR